MLLVAAYLGSTLLLYNGNDDENPFFIVHFLGIALGASLASPKVPLWLTFLGAGLAIAAILLYRNFKLLLFLFQGLLFWAFITLVVIDVRAHGHAIATATLSLIGITFAAILALRFRNVISWIGLVISAIMILLFAFGGEFFAAFALDVVLFITMIFLM
jgi:membrane protein